VKVTAKTISILLVVLIAVMIGYWALWFLHRSLIASDTTSVYYGFENAFPVADGLLALGMGVTAWALWTGSALAVLAGLMSAGGGLYLCAMDVTYDLEHGVWAKGSNGIVELFINMITLAVSVGLAWWIWGHRRQFDRTSFS
jgi:hypothetical protein